MVEDELLGYDDTASVAFIRNYIPQELKELLSDDDIVYIVDLIYDYYESRGYLSDEDQDGDEPIDIDEDELLEYVVRNAKKDGVGKFDTDQIRFVVQGELEYCESINLPSRAPGPLRTSPAGVLPAEGSLERGLLSQRSPDRLGIRLW